MFSVYFSNLYYFLIANNCYQKNQSAVFFVCLFVSLYSWNTQFLQLLANSFIRWPLVIVSHTVAAHRIVFLTQTHQLTNLQQHKSYLQTSIFTHNTELPYIQLHKRNCNICTLIQRDSSKQHARSPSVQANTQQTQTMLQSVAGVDKQQILLYIQEQWLSVKF